MIGPDGDHALRGAKQLASCVGVPVRLPHLGLMPACHQDYRLTGGTESKRINKKIAHGFKAVLIGPDTLAAQKHVS
ncbi:MULTISPECIES: hypothetical protein [unclassified Rhizobium]